MSGMRAEDLGTQAYSVLPMDFRAAANKYVVDWMLARKAPVQIRGRYMLLVTPLHDQTTRGCKHTSKMITNRRDPTHKQSHVAAVLGGLRLYCTAL